MKTNKAKVVFKALTTSFSFLLAVLLTGNAIINENAQTINGFLNETTNIMIEDENAENEDTTELLQTVGNENNRISDFTFNQSESETIPEGSLE